MTRRIVLPLCALVLASACGDAGLTVQGLVTATSADETVRRFDLRAQTRLDGSGPGRFTGACNLVRTLDDEGNAQWGAVVDVHTGGTTADEAPFSRITVMQNTGAAPEDGRVEITLGGASYTPVEGACSVEMPYALPEGVVGFTSTCEVADAAGERVTVELELDFAGCTVEG